MTLVKTTLDTVPIGGVFYGHVSGERYTKINHTKVRSEEGHDKGEILSWDEDYTVLVSVEAPQAHPPQQDEIWYDFLAVRNNSADDNEEKSWHRCHLCEYGPDGGLDAACNGCGDEHNGRIITKWKPDKAMLAWWEDMLAKHPHLAAQHQRLAVEKP
jgi:hypothetical protein